MNKKIVYKTSILMTKLSDLILKTINPAGGTSLPGMVARKISPDILSYLVSQRKKELISITGTNGKTTTSGFIASIIKNNGFTLAHNRKGANMLNGITAAIVKESSLNATLDVDYCLLESDEAYLPKLTNEIKPDIILVTNLFRDQLDRYGELDTTAKKIREAINNTSSAKRFKLLLNADDPIVSNITPDDKNINKIYYGLEEVIIKNSNEEVESPKEIASCACGQKFQYEKIFYGHLGFYYCSCGIKRPLPHIKAKAVVDTDCSTLDISTESGEVFSVKIDMPGLYNIYNALGAIATALELGIAPNDIAKGLSSYDTVFGRAENISLNGKQAIIQLIKNPIGATEVLRTVNIDPNSRLLIIINDNYADGRDVSWLWDANFELLSNHVNEIVVSGVRASDMAVRLKYAGIDPDRIKVIENMDKALDYSVKVTNNDEKLYILPTYTALLKLQGILRKYNKKSF
ncbi:MAG: Mur ligase family protein [bacterium]